LGSAVFNLSNVFACDDGTTLAVSGKINRELETKDGLYCFSFNEILNLPQRTVVTQTAWTKKSVYIGPSILDVLHRVGGYGTAVEVIAENDYSYTIAIDDFKKYNPILAYKKDGKHFTRADFGPLFLIYPRDDYPDELSLPTARAKFVWNVYRLVVQ